MTAFIRRMAFARGVAGGRRGWLVVWGVLTGMRLLRRLTSDAPEVVYRSELGPNDALVLRSRAASRR